MKQPDLFNRFNSSPEAMLAWLAAEQENGRMYSRRELLRMPTEERVRLSAPLFSRNGLVHTIRSLTDSGRVSRSDSVHGKIVVAGVPLPVGSASFLR